MKEKIEQLILAGWNVSDIAAKFKLSKRTMTRRMKSMGIIYLEVLRSKLPKELSEFQRDVILGSLLGDGTIFLRPRSKNASFKLKQKKSRLEYVQYVRELISPFSSSSVAFGKSRCPSRVNGKVCHKLEHWNGRYLAHVYFWTKSHPIFTELQKQWYNCGKKVVPKNLRLTPRMLTHWYVEDGHNSTVKKRHKYVILCTNAFSLSDVKFLIDRLLLDLDVSAHLRINKKGQSLIQIDAKSYFKFIDLVRPYVNWDCFKYKLETVNAPLSSCVDRKNKLDMNKARMIRELRQTTKTTYSKLAIQFGVSSSTIGKIVNFQLHKESSFRISGEANVHADS